MKIIILPQVLDYLDRLVYILYEKHYFSFLDSSIFYVDELLYDIETDLPAKQHKPAPKHFDKYGKGMKWAAFRKNRHTIWYVFFKTYETDGEIVYLVRYISNNHVIAQYL